MHSNFFKFSPDGQNAGSNAANGDDKKSGKNLSNAEENSEKKTLTDKIHDALQDWSNDDQRDQNIDDTRP